MAERPWHERLLRVAEHMLQFAKRFAWNPRERHDSDCDLLTRRQAWWDVSVILGASLGYVVLEALAVPKRWSFLAIALVLVAYAACLWRRRSDSWFALGFRTDNIRRALPAIGGFTALAGVLVIGWAVAHGAPLWRQDLAILLLVYPAWGIVQQAVFQGILHRRLMLLLASRAGQIGITSLVFSAVHMGSLALMTLTFLAGLCWCELYRRWPNLWLLGMSHAVLAALAYPLILGDAPLARL